MHTDTKSIQVQVRVTHAPGAEDLPLPAYQTPHAAGMDLLAAVPPAEPFLLRAGAWAMVPTGLHIALPLGFEAQVRPRSGLAAKHGIGTLNGPGTIDADYRGEIKVILFNFSPTDFLINRGERIAQMVIARVEQITWQPVAAVEDLGATDRGAGGFGHTGR